MHIFFFIGKINSAVFPGIQGGPLEHIIAAKCQCFYEAKTDEFDKYQIKTSYEVLEGSCYFEIEKKEK